MYEDFIRAIEAEGLTPPDKIIADGKKHRFDSDGQGKKNGKYILHPEKPISGFFKCYKSEIYSTWSKDYPDATPEERAKYSLIKAERKERREKDIEESTKQIGENIEKIKSLKIEIAKSGSIAILSIPRRNLLRIDFFRSWFSDFLRE